MQPNHLEFDSTLKRLAKIDLFFLFGMTLLHQREIHRAFCQGKTLSTLGLDPKSTLPISHGYCTIQHSRNYMCLACLRDTRSINVTIKHTLTHEKVTKISTDDAQTCCKHAVPKKHSANDEPRKIGMFFETAYLCSKTPTPCYFLCTGCRRSTI